MALTLILALILAPVAAADNCVYVDENPNIWYLIHALTFNLPETLAPDQVGVLSALPLFLRMHQSCDLCR